MLTTQEVSRINRFQNPSPLIFGFGLQTIPENWKESHDYSWNMTSSTGHGIVPDSESKDE